MAYNAPRLVQAQQLRVQTTSQVPTSPSRTRVPATKKTDPTPSTPTRTAQPASTRAMVTPRKVTSQSSPKLAASSPKFTSTARIPRTSQTFTGAKKQVLGVANDDSRTQKQRQQESMRRQQSAPEHRRTAKLESTRSRELKSAHPTLDRVTSQPATGSSRASASSRPVSSPAKRSVQKKEAPPLTRHTKTQSAIATTTFVAPT